MADKTNKTKGPSCACGKVDLYEELLKNKNKKEEVADSTVEDQEDKEKISTEFSSGQDQKIN